MQKYLIIALLMLVFVGCNQYKPSTFSIKGKVINATNATVKLIAFNNDSDITIIDTSIVSKNGTFTLKAYAKEETLFAIKVNNLPYYFITNDVNDIEININANKYSDYTTNKSATSADIKEYFKQYQLLENNIQKIKDSAEKAKKNNIKDSIITLLKQQETTATNTLKTFCASSINKANNAALKYITLYYGFKTNNINNQQAATYGSEAFASFKSNVQIQQLNEYIQQKVALNPETLLLNKPIIPFFIISTKGDTINSKNYNGKYVLLDFWASYSVPYRKEVNLLTETYKQYRDTNFCIIGISLDTNYTAAIRAIKTDSLKWQHCIDTLGFESNMAKKYFVKNVPLNILISPQQKIIAVNLRGAALKEKLKALYQR